MNNLLNWLMANWWKLLLACVLVIAMATVAMFVMVVFASALGLWALRTLVRAIFK